MNFHYARGGEHWCYIQIKKATKQRSKYFTVVIYKEHFTDRQFKTKQDTNINEDATEQFDEKGKHSAVIFTQYNSYKEPFIKVLAKHSIDV